MKRTRSELKKELIQSKDANVMEQENNKKKKKKASNTKSNFEVPDNRKEIIQAKEDIYIKLYKQIKAFLEKFEFKLEISDKDLNISTERFKKIRNISKFKVVYQMELYYKHKYEDFHKIAISEDICSICQYAFYDNLKSKTLESILEEDTKEDNHVILLENCSDHYFHSECLEMMIGDKSFIKCPNCNKIYGIMTGDQPPGKMSAKAIKKRKCEGFNCDTIEMYFEFPDGEKYTGTYRVGYLPNNKEGRELLGLFKVAFDRKLLFTIGTSVTTGATNTTIWNGIHFKTSMNGGPAYFGYPDPTYFSRVRQEFAAKGIIQDNIKENLEDLGNSFFSKQKKNNLV